MKVLAREELTELSEDLFKCGVNRIHARVEAVVGEALDRMVKPVLAVVAELRQSLQQGVTVARDVDLGDDVDAEAVSEIDEAVDQLLGVVAAALSLFQARSARNCAISSAE
jgi:hypothetical protein